VSVTSCDKSELPESISARALIIASERAGERERESDRWSRWRGDEPSRWFLGARRRMFSSMLFVNYTTEAHRPLDTKEKEKRGKTLKIMSLFVEMFVYFSLSIKSECALCLYLPFK